MCPLTNSNNYFQISEDLKHQKISGDLVKIMKYHLKTMSGSCFINV